MTYFVLTSLKTCEKFRLALRAKPLAHSATGKSQPASRRPPNAGHWFGHAAPEKPERPQQARCEMSQLSSGESPCESRYPAAAILLLIRTPGAKQDVAPSWRSRLAA